MYTVKEVSEIMDISPYTLRFYDSEGLFPQLTRRGGRRYFSTREIGLVSIIQCLRETGMPLNEIKRYIDAVYEGETTIPERYEMVVKQRIKAKQEIKEWKQRLKILDNKAKYYESMMENKDGSKYLLDVNKLIEKSLGSVKCMPSKIRTKSITG